MSGPSSEPGSVEGVELCGVCVGCGVCGVCGVRSVWSVWCAECVECVVCVKGVECGVCEGCGVWSVWCAECVECVWSVWSAYGLIWSGCVYVCCEGVLVCPPTHPSWAAETPAVESCAYSEYGDTVPPTHGACWGVKGHNQQYSTHQTHDL